MRYCSFIRLLCLLLVIITVSGCSKAIELSSTDVILLLTRCKQFMFFCLTILSHDPPSFNQAASRYYYAMFSLARVIYGQQSRSPFTKESFHVSVWNSFSKTSKEITNFGMGLKRLRERCDYGVKAEDLKPESYKKDFKRAVYNDKVFEELIEEIQEVYRDFPPAQGHVDQCDQLVEEIDSIRESIKKHDCLNRN